MSRSQRPEPQRESRSTVGGTGAARREGEGADAARRGNEPRKGTEEKHSISGLRGHSQGCLPSPWVMGYERVTSKRGLSTVSIAAGTRLSATYLNCVQSGV